MGYPSSTSRVLAASTLVVVLFHLCTACQNSPCTVKYKKIGLPRFEISACPPKLYFNGTASATCGYLVVPEKRGAFNGKAKELRLPVMHLCPNGTVRRELHEEQKQSPIVYLHGGPADSNMISANTPGSVLATTAAKIANRVGRDVIIYDQRGGLLMKPKIPDCTQLNQECFANITSAGFDLTAYNTLSNAADLEDLRDAFYATNLNIFGSSYGSMLALRYSLDFPDRVRSLLLTGAAWVDEYNGYALSSPRGFENIMSRVISDCEGDVKCSNEYPYLRRSYEELLSNPKAAEPVTLRGLVRGSRDPVSDGFEMSPILKIASIIDTVTPLSGVPAFIELWNKYLKHSDNSSPEARLLSAFDKKLFSGGALSLSSMNFPIFKAVSCYDFDKLRTDEAEKLVNDGTRTRVALSPEARNVGCDLLPPLVDPIVHPPLNHSIPTIAMVGTYDFKTPIVLGRGIVAELKNAKLLPFKGYGHALLENGVSCAVDTFVKFLNDPQGTAFIEPSCVAQAKPFFPSLLEVAGLVNSTVVPTTA